MFHLYCLFLGKLELVDHATTLQQCIALALANWHENGVSSQLMTVTDRWSRTVCTLFSTEPEKVTITTITNGRSKCKVVHCKDRQVVQPRIDHNSRMNGSSLGKDCVASEGKYTIWTKNAMDEWMPIGRSFNLSTEVENYLTDNDIQNGEVQYGSEMIGRIQNGRIYYVSCVENVNE